MIDVVKRTILKTLREFDRLKVIPTIEDLFFSLDTSEVKGGSVKRPLYDEALEDLLRLGEIVISSVEGIFFVTLPHSREFVENLIDYRKEYKKETAHVIKKLAKMQRLPFILNASTLNLISMPGSEHPRFYIFTKDNASKLTSFILKMLMLTGKDSKAKIKIIEHKDIKQHFPERQIQYAYKLANLHPILNKNNFYENLIYNNRWVFEILGNFPVSRISLNYRGSNKKENFDSSVFTKILNKISGLF